MEEELKNQYEVDVSKAQAIRELFSSPGWKIYKSILDTERKKLESIKGISTIKELEARKTTIQILDKIDSYLTSIVEQGEEANKILKSLK